MPVETKKQEQYLKANPSYKPFAERFEWLMPFGDDTYGRPIFHVPVELICPNPWNPNVESNKTFDGLVGNIAEAGFVQNIQLVFIPDVLDSIKAEYPDFEAPEGVEFMIIGGEHRFEAAKYLDMEALPSVIMTDITDVDLSMFMTTKMNILAGELDPMKFTDMVNRLLKTGKYSKDLVATMMGFADSAAFDKLYIQVKSAVPKQIRKRLDDVKDEIKTADDLSAVVHRLMAQYGKELTQHSFMIFEMGGKTHALVKMDDGLMKQVQAMSKHARENEGNVAALLTEWIKGGLGGC